MPTWIETNEAEEAVSALESFVRFLGHIENDLLNWRWAIISLHISTQGFMVVALRDSAGLIPLRDDVAEKWLSAYREKRQLPEEKLDSFRNLYKKTKNKDIAKQLNAKPFTPTGDQGKNIKRLSEFRDRFIHFLPSSWSLEADGLPQICSDVLSLIDFLVNDYRWILWHDEEHPGRIKQALEAARDQLHKLAQQCAPADR